MSKSKPVRNGLILHIAPRTSKIGFGWIQGHSKSYIIVYLGSVTRKVNKLTDGRRSQIANGWVLGHEKVARIWNMLKYQNLSETNGRATDRTVIETSFTRKKKLFQDNGYWERYQWFSGHMSKSKPVRNGLILHIAPRTSKIGFGWIQDHSKSYIIVYLGSVTIKVNKLTDGRRSQIANGWVLGHEKVARIWNMLKYQNLSKTNGRATARTVIETSFTSKKNYSKITDIERDISDLVGICQNRSRYATAWYYT